MTDPIRWPINILPFQSVMFARMNITRSGGQSVTGIEQIVASSFEQWQARVTVKIHKPSQVLTYRAMMAQKKGRASEWIVPACSGFERLGTPAAGGFYPVIGVPTVDRSTLGDLSPFADDGEVGTSLVLGTVATGASPQSTSLSVHMSSSGQAPLPGQYFTSKDRLYEIGTVTNTGTDQYTLTFSPPLRVLVVAGDTIDFSRPHCLMRLKTDAEGMLDLDMLRFASVSLEFVEVFRGY